MLALAYNFDDEIFSGLPRPWIQEVNDEESADSFYKKLLDKGCIRCILFEVRRNEDLNPDFVTWQQIYKNRVKIY